MGKTYKNYYVLIPIKTRIIDDPPVIPEPDNTFSEEGFFDKSDNKINDLKDINYKVVSGTIFMGSRFATTLLDVEGIKELLNIYSQEEAFQPLVGDTDVITSIKLSTQSNAIKLGVFSIYSITLIPEDLNKTIPPYGLRYVSRIPASGNLDPRSVAIILYGQKFPITDNGVTATYVVESNSVKRVHCKKFSGTIPVP